MCTIQLRPEDPARDFKEIAALISSQEEFAQSEQDLLEDYQKNEATRLCFRAAEDETGQFMGFSWAWRHWLHPERSDFYVVVKPEHRRRGAGKCLYDDLLAAVKTHEIQLLGTSVMEDSPASLEFVKRRGFHEVRHGIHMELDLDRFDDQPFEAILARLTAEGFCFTSMEELGNTEEAQRKLYALNDSTERSTLGQNGDPTWASFEAFQKSVCGSNWYRPAGQIVAIDTSTGTWAAMSAISIVGNVDHAYNLFTGVDPAYRGRQLGQAVKVLALRYARSVLQVHSVQTDHNTKNLPMIAIDRKLGYAQTWGKHLLEKKVKDNS